MPAFGPLEIELQIGERDVFADLLPHRCAVKPLLREAEQAVGIEPRVRPAERRLGTRNLCLWRHWRPGRPQIRSTDQRTRLDSRKRVKCAKQFVHFVPHLQKGLGIPGPEIAGASKLDATSFLAMIDRVVESHPKIKVVATTLRDVHSTNRHSWGAVAWLNGESYVSPTCQLDILDRVGGGDGFASGFFYGLLTGESPAEAVNLGWAHGALLTTYPGDTTMATVDQVRAFAKGGSSRIQR